MRVVPATYHKPPVLRGLVEIEGMTNARLNAERGKSLHLDPRELAWHRRRADLRVYGETHVNAAFTYTRVGGNRFNDAVRGASYCAWDALVSVAEVAFHRTRELAFAGLFKDEAGYVGSDPAQCRMTP